MTIAQFCCLANTQVFYFHYFAIRFATGSRCASRPSPTCTRRFPGTGGGASSIPTPSCRGSIPTPTSRGSIPTPTSWGSIPTPTSRGSIPTPTSRGSIPTPTSRGSIPTLTSRSYCILYEASLKSVKKSLSYSYVRRTLKENILQWRDLTETSECYDIFFQTELYTIFHIYFFKKIIKYVFQKAWTKSYFNFGFFTDTSIKNCNVFLFILYFVHFTIIVIN